MTTELYEHYSQPDLLPRPDDIQTPPPAYRLFFAIEGPSLPPPGYAVAAMADGFYYPQRVEPGNTHARFVPLISGIQPTSLVKFFSYLAAVEYCWEETFAEGDYEGGIERVMRWQEASPYADHVEDFQQLLVAWTGERACFSLANGFAVASLDPFPDDPHQLRFATQRDTIEDALKGLCEQVYAFARPFLELAQDGEWETWWQANDQPH